MHKWPASIICPGELGTERVSHKFKFEGDAIEAIEIQILSAYVDFCFVHVVKVKVDENLEQHTTQATLGR